MKILNGWSEVVYRRRTDNTMTKGKKGQKDKQSSTKHYTTTNIRPTGTSLNSGVNAGAPEG